jgi:hypothetical protein
VPDFRTALQALRELGPSQVGLFALYRFGLRSGHYRRVTARAPGAPESVSAGASTFTLRTDIFKLPTQSALATMVGENAGDLLAQAEEIAAGQVRLFGSEPAPLRVEPEGPLEHWTALELKPGGWAGDPKLIWEPARFGWAFTLGRSYLFSAEERYPAVFWACTERFLDANPPYLGPHWTSAQEVALRLMALVWAAHVFAPSAHSTPGRSARLGEAVAVHAARIPPTLPYARAQHNNHLLAEAAGLYTAGLALPDHPEAKGWKDLGWRWLNRGLQAQIAPDGAYAQHSANYHRLALQLALWAGLLAGEEGRPFPELTRSRLAAAARWLLALLDRPSGRLPNLGPNDGAYVFPLASQPSEDYRPVLQAASRAFLRGPALEPGPWDEMSLWLGLPVHMSKEGQETAPQSGEAEKRADLPSHGLLENTPHLLRGRDSWAYLRAARFISRPGHADQLHLDLWWRGLNVAQDAGTYLYNAGPPWDNALARTEVHNTLTLDGQDQMQRAGRFLWLHWAQARTLSRERAPDGGWERMEAEHNGYRHQGAIHRRSVTVYLDDLWVIEDRLLPAGGSEAEEASRSGRGPGAPQGPTRLARLHWLLPDGEWELVSEAAPVELRIRSPWGWISLQVLLPKNEPDTQRDENARLVKLARAGELLAGSGPVSPTAGWVSPTYGARLPALSLAVEVRGRLPLTLVSEWRFPCTSY